MYRGMPSNDKDPRGYNAAQRQVLAWKKSPRAHVTTRPLRYPYDYPERKPEEKGIDVHIAIDFAMMAVRGEYDVGILMSGDTDLRPALETVSTLHGVKGEVAAWGTSSGYGRRLSVPGHNIWCHWITEAARTPLSETTPTTTRRPGDVDDDAKGGTDQRQPPQRPSATRQRDVCISRE